MCGGTLASVERGSVPGTSASRYEGWKGRRMVADTVGIGPLVGKVAVVTGGGRGIGAATAHALARAGARVAVMARTTAQIDTVAAEIRAAGGVAEAVRLDVSDPSFVQWAIDEVVARLGAVDILINNAGVAGPLGPTAQIDLSEWIESLTINLIGAFACIRAVLPGMLERRWGRIVNVSTGAAIGTGMIPANAYSASKAGLEMLTVNLAAELSGRGVLVHAVRPGVVESDMQTFVRTRPAELVGEAMASQFRALKEEGRLLSPDQPALLIVRLLAEGTTGELISIYDARGQGLLKG